MSALLAGFTLAFTLILAIGAQNAFVLRQGLRRRHVFLVCLLCALSDAILIALGVLGFGAAVKAAPWIVSVARYGGAAFLFVYGALSFRAAFTQTQALLPGGEEVTSAKKTALVCLMLTWLNPHVYLDTVVLLGSLSLQYADARLFGIGAAAASFVFFFTLGYGAKLLIPFFRRPQAWKALEIMIGVIMISIALSLVTD